MRLQLWRNATLVLTISGTRFLIDPMLSMKGELGKFPWTEDNRRNPLVNLPFSVDVLPSKLKQIDAVVISHLHPDHWDEVAVELISKSTTIICPASLKDNIAAYGFNNIQVINNQLILDQIKIHLINGMHGSGKIGELMGKVNGFVFSKEGQSVYVTGDTVWCEEVHETIVKHQPQHIIVAGGAATFSIGEPVTMSVEDIRKLAKHAPNSSIWVTHLEAVSPCKEDRLYIKEFLRRKCLQDQRKILADGEEVELN